MSNTFKDVPFWVRQKRALTVTEHHVGCPLAEVPRRRLVEVTTVTEPCWQLVDVVYGLTLWGEPKTRQVWRYEPLRSTGKAWEPYWVDVCDLEVRGHHKLWSNTCNYELGRNDPLWHERSGKTSLRPQQRHDRHAAKTALKAARDEWNTTGWSDLQPAPDRRIEWR